MKTKRIICFKLCLILALCLFPFSIVLAEESEPKVFTIDKIIDPSWGELVSVFDQKNSQRLTFDNEGEITLVLLHMSWSSKENGFIPSVRQIIKLKKKEST